MSKTSKTIAEKTAELTDLVDWFNGDDFSLEQALDKFKSAEALATDIERDLMALKNDIEVVKQRFDNEG